MIDMEELEKRITEMLKIFKKRTKILACSVLDNDGFIIATIKDDFMEDDLYNKKIINLYNVIDLLRKNDGELIDFHKDRELISFGVVDDFFNDGFMILVKSLENNLTFITIFPKLLNIRPISTQFEKVIDELSKYFLEAKNQGISKKMYKLM